MHTVFSNVSKGQAAKKEDLLRLKQSNHIPIRQAQMRVQLIISSKDTKKFKEKLMKLSSLRRISRFINAIDPGVFRELDDLISAETRGQEQLELLSLTDVVEADETFDEL